MCLSLAKHLLTVGPMAAYTLVLLTCVFNEAFSVWQETELLVAGIPCIDVSSAGHRKGAAGLVRPSHVLLRLRAEPVCGLWPWQQMCVRLGQSTTRRNVGCQNLLFDSLLAVHLQSTGCGRHVFRLLRVAARNNHPIPWLLLENVRFLPAAD
jgi:hypothetical protein